MFTVRAGVTCAVGKVCTRTQLNDSVQYVEYLEEKREWLKKTQA